VFEAVDFRQNEDRGQEADQRKDGDQKRSVRPAKIEGNRKIARNDGS
jgi:hypothetical protein